MIFASTNKVYGDLADVELVIENDAYVPKEAAPRAGVSERRPLDFHTPYGCSKGAADQYVLDYGRSFGLATCVLRMSCIYGPRQMGTEDQGWVAHFLIRVLRGQSITLYGDGRQVRDILHVSDAVDAYLAAWLRIDEVKSRAFNLGGGPDNAVSLRQVLGEIEILTGAPARTNREDWRPGDQRYYVSDTSAAETALRLLKAIDWRSGLADLAAWLKGTEGPIDHAARSLADAFRDEVREEPRLRTKSPHDNSAVGVGLDLLRRLDKRPCRSWRGGRARRRRTRRLGGADRSGLERIGDQHGFPAGLAGVSDGDCRNVQGAGVARTRGKPDLVHLNAPLLAAVGDFGVPVLGVCHSCMATWWAAVKTGPMPEDFVWRTGVQAQGLARCDALLAPSRSFAEAVFRSYGRRPGVVLNGRRDPGAGAGEIAEFHFTAGRLCDEGKNLRALDVAAGLSGLRIQAAGPVEGPGG